MAPLRHLSLANELAEALKADILNSVIRPSEPLAEEVVAETYRVSRPTARNAITVLAAEGLVRREPHRAAFVPRLSPQDVRDLFRVRRPIELEAVRLITLKNLRVPPAAYEATQQLEKLSSDTPHDVIVTTNISFHRCLVDGVNNTALVRCFLAIQGEIQLALIQSRTSYDSAEVALEHGRLLEILEEHDWERARFFVLSHLKSSGASIVKGLEDPAFAPR